METRHEADRRVKLISEAEAALTNADAKRQYDEKLFPPPPVEPPEPSPARPEPIEEHRFDPEPKPEPLDTPDATDEGIKEKALAWIKNNRAVSGVVGGTLVIAFIVAATTGIRDSSETTTSNTNEVVSTEIDNQSSTPQSTPSTPQPSPSTQSPSPVASPTPTTIDAFGANLKDGYVIGNGGLPFIIPIGSVEIELEGLMSGSERSAGREEWVLAQTAEGPRLVGLISVFHAADGLTPESTEMRLIFIDADHQSVNSQTTLWEGGDNEPLFLLSGSSEGVVVVSMLPNEFDPDNISTGYDALTGSELWQHQGEVDRTVKNIALMESIIPAESSGFGVECNVVSGVDLESGTVVWSVDGSWVDDPETDCSSIELASPLVTSDNDTPSDLYVAIEYGDLGSVLDPITGDKLAWRASDAVTQGIIDPISGHVYSSYSSEGAAAVVYDPRSGEEIFSVPSEQASDLRLSVSAFFDGKLYASTTAESLVIDTVSGETLSTDWEDAPVAIIGDWILTRDGLLEKRADQ